MDFTIYAPYLRSNWHALSVHGDLRSQYAPFDNPPSGAQTYSYIKTTCLAGTTPLTLVMQNQGTTPCTASFASALITQDADLYANVATSDPGLPTTPPVWVNAPFGSNGTVTIQPGGRFTGNFAVATPNPNQTLVVRSKLVGAPLWIQSLSYGLCETY